ncbi:transcription-repair coupling factor [Apilactobacillus ozensis DSM 23829 = JCM 17196]|uniref:Transcription-repair-coupling factor n=1 Tax=Apilactobacillus ozensis DSM 23829 = JCM 17196 TaxID=1423781 RepID=A0A0R2B019_9LACO|nr:transcription-repair coupling factor [Apilactobacillus ozensis]KRM69321.1 transcription-repair coupling factor [Apilactobacillus ozensis DSM 23829 = JCM 17196]
MKLGQFFTELADYKKIKSELKPEQRQLVTGLSGSAKTMFLANLMQDTKKQMVVVTDTLAHANGLSEDLRNLLPENEVFEFPVEELLAAEIATSSPQFKLQRVEALMALQSNRPAIIVTSISGTRRYLPAAEDFKNACLHLKVGSDYDITKLRGELFDLGYIPQKMVSAPGEFSIRGSIVDIYPLNSEYPIRIDFFDTEIDSLRFFDASNQRSVDNLDSFSVIPASDFIFKDIEKKRAAKNIETELLNQLDDMQDDNLSHQLNNNIQPIISDLKKGIVSSQALLFSKYLFSKSASIFQYLADGGLVVFDDYSRLLDSNRQLVADEQNWLKMKIENAEVLPNLNLGWDFLKLFKRIKQTEMLLSMFQKGLGRMKLAQIVDLKVRPMQKFFGQMPMLKTEIDRWKKQKDTVVIMVKDVARIDKVNKTLEDFEIKAVQTSADKILEHTVQIIPESLNNGFEIKAAQLAIITESEMFAKVNKRKPRRQTFSNAERIKSYSDLKQGDYVVHVNHGIGQYKGMQTMEVDGKHQDYMTIDYRDNAQLFIPVTQLNLIQKYVSSEDRHPRVNKLGGSEWQKTKNKVQSKIEDIADDLIALYAKRSAEKGFAFPKDDEYQQKFEDEFPYQETPDQLRSAEEIKHDMEQPHPMDRLLVGDVGYGKTEVALRAAFKAVEAGKQVAFLVPTTVLAHQHYETMLNRFESFPVNISVLSRFRSRKQVNETKKSLEDGSIDIVVGTHRLLSKDIKFNDLGLLMVDEEQRFGVKHKEKIKQLKDNVDVLTLTATPIPRTLNMSMMGVRDLSVIETPPANRYPIQTYVMEENAGAIREGITRELQRGGQVFYMHNRVNDIEETVSHLQALLPDARISYIHGQMTENQLETILYDFINGEYDVLVTTTIIETGVDIPNANTLFVENADHMGLSQLYQIRGRIGRSNRLAYAYFMYKPNKVLTEVSENRLEAIRDFTELGSGFKIAMRDLSLRGAGNLLGKQQSGFVDSVGYDLYTQMLSDEVAKKRGKKLPYKVNSTIELGIEAYLPSDYISDAQQKIELYKRIRQMENNDQYMEVQDDLIDRFGEYPTAVSNLLSIGKLKMLADVALIEQIKHQGNNIIINFSKAGTDALNNKTLLKFISQTNFRSTISDHNNKIQVKLIIQPNSSLKDWLNGLVELITLFEQEIGKTNNEK